MRSEFGGLNIALRALLAQQQALETTGHNIANANTEGYSRQVVRMRAANPLSIAGVQGQLGSGAEVAAIERVRSAFFDHQIRVQNHTLGRWGTTEQFLGQIELVYNEPSENGIAGTLGRFWNAWREVASTPEAASARRALIARGEDLATLLNTVGSNLVALQRDADRRIQLRVDDINNTAEKIALLNDRITRVLVVGDQPNDLRDERDKLLTTLSKLVDFVTSEDAGGAITVTVGGRNLITGTNIERLSIATDPANNNFLRVVWQRDGAAVGISDGEVQALLTVRDTHLAGQLRDLDALATTLMSSVNAQHRAGFRLQPGDAAGTDFFTGTNASSITVSPAVRDDPNAIAAASAAGRAGDGRNALAIADLQKALLLGGTTQSFEEFFAGMMTRLGADAQHATLARESQEILVEHMQRQQQAQAGVSLDEEAARLIQYQRAFQAAARVISITDEILDRIINGMGAGR